MSTVANANTKQLHLLGFYVSILTAVMTVITFGIAILTPPKSGPNCTEGCFKYPYLDITSRFPRDYYWMGPAIIMMSLYLIWVVCIHNYAPTGKKVFSQIALCFALLSAGILIVNYFVQVSVVQVSLKHGETEGIPLLTQFNSHGLFIALEEIGYLLMAVSFLFIAPVFSGAIRWIGILCFVLTILAFVLVSISYGIDRQDNFEIAVISITWLSLLITSILTSLTFRRAAQK